jgi:hypothetical protein
MLRGLAAVSTLSFSYFLGWATTDLLVRAEFVTAAEYAVLPVLLLITVLSDRQWLLSLLTALLFPVGLYLGATLVTTALSREAMLLLLVLSLAALFLAVRFYQGYRYFAEQFAITVYRDFFVLERMAANPAVGAQH